MCGGIHGRSGLMPKSSVNSHIGVHEASNLLDADQMKVEYDLKNVRMFTRGMITNPFLYILLTAHPERY